MRARWLAAAALFFAGCGPVTRTVATNPSPRPLAPRAPDTVRVYTTTAPARDFVEVAVIQSTGRSYADDMPALIIAMRAESARLGCDALVIRGATERAMSVAGSGGGSTETVDGFWGACLVYTSPGTVR